MRPMQIRQISAAERTDTMFPLQTYAFFPSPWDDEKEREAYRRRMVYYETTVSMIAEEDGQALAGVGALPMRQNVRGGIYDMAGIASVASHPAARRRGFIRALLDRLLREMRDRGCAVTALYPFRPSFYAQFGYVGLPRRRTAELKPEGLGHLLRADLPGTVERLPMAEGFDTYDALVLRLLEQRHGLAVYDDVRKAEFRHDKRWVAIARAGDEVVGAVSYRIDRFGGDLVAGDLLTTGPLGRALLLQFFARHVDQVARVVVTVGLDDAPELWGTDLPVRYEGRVAYPSSPGPMARVLDLGWLAGMPVGEGAVTVRVVDDLIGGTYCLTGENGRLAVTSTVDADTTLTAAGLSGLVYGVLDPIDVVTRGFGTVDDGAVEPLRALFPRALPYLMADF
jgi:predicted N-acetyltransferase YhbS